MVPTLRVTVKYKCKYKYNGDDVSNTVGESKIQLCKQQIKYEYNISNAAGKISTKCKYKWNDDNVSNADGDSQRKMSAFEDAAA